jgi:hypothetical protein
MHFFEEDGDALDRLCAEGSLGRGELEGIGNFVGEGMRRYGGCGVV